MPSIGIIHYGMGNIGSVRGALEECGAAVHIAYEPQQIQSCDALILPGVGAFYDGMMNLRAGGWLEAIQRYTLEQQKPLLGICLGMQLLADWGDEGGRVAGLGLIAGQISHLNALGCTGRVPHVGWDDITLVQSEHPIFNGVPAQTDFYFVHSYAYRAQSPEHTLATCVYAGVEIPAVIARDRIWGTQFHPEKSSKAGFAILRNFLEEAC